MAIRERLPFEGPHHCIERLKVFGLMLNEGLCKFIIEAVARLRPDPAGSDLRGQREAAIIIGRLRQAKVCAKIAMHRRAGRLRGASLQATSGKITKRDARMDMIAIFVGVTDRELAGC